MCVDLVKSLNATKSSNAQSSTFGMLDCKTLKWCYRLAVASCLGVHHLDHLVKPCQSGPWLDQLLEVTGFSAFSSFYSLCPRRPVSCFIRQCPAVSLLPRLTSILRCRLCPDLFETFTVLLKCLFYYVIDCHAFQLITHL